MTENIELNHGNSAPEMNNIDLAKLQVSIVRLTSILQGTLDEQACQDIRLCWSYLRQHPTLDDERSIFFEALHKYYIDGYPMALLAQLTGISLASISNNFKNLGFYTYGPARRTEFASTPNRKYALDADALSEPSRELTAYVLGFTWADGTLIYSSSSKAYQGLRFVLKASDSDHLKFLRAFFGSTSPIQFFPSSIQKCGSRFRQCRLALYSRDLANQLLSYGFHLRKGGKSNVAPPAVIRQNEIAFWRGMVDGDGSIRRDKRPRFPLSGWTIELAATHVTASLFKRFILTHVPDAKVDFRKNGISECNYKVSVSGPHAIQVINLLYPANRVALARKGRLAKWVRTGLQLADTHSVTVGTQAGRAHWIGCKSSKAKVALALPPFPSP